jgi:CheY-like chemotaxis protein
MTTAFATETTTAARGRELEVDRPPARPMRLLLVRDGGVDAATAPLREAGFDVQTAAAGVEALGRTIARRPDVIVLDLRSSRAAGLEVARRLKAAAATRAIPLLALVGRAATDDEAALRAGCEAVIHNPLRPAQLGEEVRSRMAGRRPRPRRRGRCGRS